MSDTVPSPRPPADDALIDLLGHAVIATDLAGIVFRWNRAAEVMYGWSADEAIGRPIYALTVPEAMQDVAAEIMHDVEAGLSWSGVFTVRRKDESTFLALVTDTGIRGADGQLVGIVGVSLNLADAVRPFLQRSREAMLVTDAAGTVRLVSPGITALLGWRNGDLVGKSWWRYVHPDDRAAARAAHATAVSTTALVPPSEHRARRPDGSWLWVDTSETNLLDEPMVRGMLLTLRDVTERRASVEELKRRALHDPLTGLVNRAVFMEHVTSHVAQRQHAGAVLYVDLDHFKNVNDRFGHEGGDLVLRTVAERLRASVRPEDVCGRLGGDEFAVLAPTVTEARQAIALARRVAAAVKQSIAVDTAVFRPEASVGIAMLTGTGDADRAIRLADENMYVRKRRRAARRRRASMGSVDTDTAATS